MNNFLQMYAEIDHPPWTSEIITDHKPHKKQKSQIDNINI